MKSDYLLGLLTVVVIGIAGCNVIPTIAYVAGGTMVAPQYKGLEQSRVAVVCVSDDASYGSGTESERLSRGIAMILEERVPEIDIVKWPDIADWIDRKGWDHIDYREVGRGVKADRVVAIDLTGFRVREGGTLFKGRADLTVTVFDMTAGGKEVFQRDIVEFTFPKNGPYHAADISENRFSKLFLKVLSGEVAKYFHEYDMIDEYGSPNVFDH